MASSSIKKGRGTVAGRLGDETPQGHPDEYPETGSFAAEAVSEYLVVIEKAETNYAAFSPDLPGCVATGITREEALERMRQAISLHIQELKEDGLPVPESSSSAEYLAV